MLKLHHCNVKFINNPAFTGLFLENIRERFSYSEVMRNITDWYRIDSTISSNTKQITFQ